jgi:hypothetical protein
MAQVRRQTRDPSPPLRQISSIPDTLHFLSSPSRNTGQTHSFQFNDLSPYSGSPIRLTNQQQTFNHWQPPLPPPSQTGLIYNSTTRKYDPLTGLLINPSTSTTITTNYNNNNNENYEQSYIVSTPLNQVTQRERQLLPPPPPQPPPPPSSEDVYLFQQQQYERQKLNNNEVRAIY